jgi:hypothetical protein
METMGTSIVRFLRTADVAKDAEAITQDAECHFTATGAL